MEKAMLKHKNRLVKFFILLLISVLLIGCASQKAWKYGPEAAVNGTPLIDKSVVVPPFDDQRVNDNSSMVGMYLIPLVPYGWQELNTPEGVTMHINSTLWQWRPNEDIAKATAEEINNAGVFKEAFYSNRASEGDLVLQGTIKSSKYDGKIITYGLSVYGPVLWLVGLPSANITNDLALVFKLEDKKNKKTLWQKEYKEHNSQTSWIYHLKSDFNYSEMLKKILLNVARDIKSEVPQLRNSIIEPH